MNKYVSRGLWFVLVVGGLTVAGATAANAAETSGDDGVLSGSQAIVGTSTPVTVQNNAVSVLGDSSSTGSGATGSAGSGAPATAAPATTSGNDAAASGSQGIVSLAVPVTVAGNAISVLGDSSSTGTSPSDAAAQPSQPSQPSQPAAPAQSAAQPATSGDDSLAGGTQLLAAPVAPVTVAGNAISVLGDSSSSGTSGAGSMPAAAEMTNPMTSAATSGDDSLVGGTQLLAAPVAPVTVGGNAVSLVGDSSGSGASSDGTAGASSDGTTGTPADGTAGASPTGTPTRRGLTIPFPASVPSLEPAIDVSSGVETGGAGIGAPIASAAPAVTEPESGLTSVLAASLDPRPGTVVTAAGSGAEASGGTTHPAAVLAHTGIDTAGWIALAAVLLTGGLVLIGLTERGGLRS